MSATQTERLNFSSVKNKPDYPDFWTFRLNPSGFFPVGNQIRRKRPRRIVQNLFGKFPITDTRNQFVLEFLDYFVDP